MVLDIAAGVLIAAAIIGLVRLGVSVVEATDSELSTFPIGWAIVAVGLVSGAALVAWRLFR